MTNRINGDFDQDAIEAFRAAYAAQLANPEDHEIDPVNGLPTNIVHNTSPWIQHTGLWKANDGMSRDFKPNQPFNSDDYFPASSEDEDADEVVEDTEEDAVYLTDEEFERLSEEIWGSGEDDSDDNSEGDSGDDDNETPYEEDPYEESETEEELNEDEIDALIDEILSERLEDDKDSEGSGEYENDDDGEYNDEE